MIASAALKASFGSIDSFLSEITGSKTVGGDEEDDDFSLFGSDTSARRGRDAYDIENAYRSAKEEENAVRTAFTFPDAPDAPYYDLRKKQPEPEPPAAEEPPLDTSDVNVYNDELFRRFEDDSVFEGVHDNDDVGFDF